jgi:regulator of protease activity HflC (stomatin/prohibitin superfamily)
MNTNQMDKRLTALLGAGIAVAAVVLLIFTGLISETVPKGHVGVTSNFGNVRDQVYESGLHFPVAPWWSWDKYDVRQKTFEIRGIGVPTQDKLVTEFDLNIQYSVIPSRTPDMLKETGLTQDVITVHLEPKARSLLRELGKTITKSEDLFMEGTQERLQETLELRLVEFMDEQGLDVTAVLLRNMELPQVVMEEIQRTKQREQEAVRQQAELDRFRIEQEQQVVKAESERKAAEEEAQKIQLLADAKAYEIQKINEALANAPGYLRLEALKTLVSMSENPASQLFFLDGNAPMPLPLLHMGDAQGERTAGLSPRVGSADE